MEIHQLPPRTVHALGAPSKTEDGDSSSSGNFYRRSSKQQASQEHPEQPQATPSLEGTSTIIDIRV